MLSCLEHGRWVDAGFTTANLSQLLATPHGARYQCPERRLELSVQRKVWVGQPSCNEHLADPLGDDFSGTFSDYHSPVHLAFLADSVGGQVRSALLGAIEANPALSHLHLAQTCPIACNLATIPRSAAGCRQIISTITWPAQHSTGGRSGGRRSKTGSTAGGAGRPVARPRRIILAGSGMWYNLRPYCNGTGASLFGIDANATCAHKVLHHTIHPEDIELDHAKPLDIHPRQFWRRYHQHFGTYDTSALGHAANTQPALSGSLLRQSRLVPCAGRRGAGTRGDAGCRALRRSPSIARTSPPSSTQRSSTHETPLPPLCGWSRRPSTLTEPAATLLGRIARRRQPHQWHPALGPHSWKPSAPRRVPSTCLQPVHSSS